MREKHLGLDKMDPKMEEMVKDYAKNLSEQIKVEKIIVNGSDVIVISDDFKDMDFFDRLQLLEFSWHYTMPVQTLGYTNEELKNMEGVSKVITAALKDGIVIKPNSE